MRMQWVCNKNEVVGGYGGKNQINERETGKGQRVKGKDGQGRMAAK